ncbi:C-type lectin 37Da [Drosophila biarmipes]|uniref:C-type lectin 37Da n=1 Tax=Drosophila biarmipes TaxID=125945 RepID=UPI0007E85712|nr:C-type lectin 37Da [Drosophila biarmipes]
MILKLVVLSAFVGVLSPSAAYKITTNVIDGVPSFLNITTAPFIKIGTGYYFIQISIPKNWHAAFESCRRMEADLVAFESLEEFNMIWSHLSAMHPVRPFWTAGTDFAEQGKHEWFSNGQPVPSTLWRKGEPNNYGNNEHCDNIYVTHGFGLNDDVCSKLFFYVCKAPQPKTASFIVW